MFRARNISILFLICSVFLHSFVFNAENAFAIINSKYRSAPNGSIPAANGAVRAILSAPNGQVYIGGDFTSVGGTTRNGVARFLADGTLDGTWHPNASGGTVNAFLLGTSTLYVGGAFTSIGGQTRSKIAEIDLTTASATAWNPNSNNSVLGFALGTSTIYVAGSFSSIGGLTRRRLAELSLTTASATPWHPNATSSGGAAYAIILATSTAYTGGTFSTTGGGEIGGQPRNYLAEIHLQTASATPWNPNAANSVYSIAVGTSTLYAGGEFNALANLPNNSRNRLVEVDLTTASATPWSPNAGTGVVVNSIVLASTTFYAGGTFTSVGAQSRNKIAELDLSTGSSTTWNPNASGTINIVARSSSTIPTIYIGGDFTALGSATQSYFAQFDPLTVQFESSASSGSEATTPASLPLVLNATTSWNVTVNYAVSGGTATGGGTDYTLASGTATIAAGNTTTSISVTIADDATEESDETVIVALSNPDGAYLGTATTTTYTITNNDTAASSGGGGRSDSAPPVRSEGNPLGTLSATTTSAVLSLKTDEEATCKYSTSPNGPMTTAYNGMPFFFTTTGGATHSASVGGLHTNQSYAYYIRCQDSSGNNNVDDFSINFSVAGADTSLPTPTAPAPTSTPPAPTAQEPSHGALFLPETLPISHAPLLLVRSLARGISGNDTLLLQEKLRSLGFFPATVSAVPYFGPVTQKSVQAYQCARKIVCAGTPATTGYGRVGPKTRAALGRE